MIREWMICSSCWHIRFLPLHWLLRLSGLCPGEAGPNW